MRKAKPLEEVLKQDNIISIEGNQAESWGLWIKVYNGYCPDYPSRVKMFFLHELAKIKRYLWRYNAGWQIKIEFIKERKAENGTIQNGDQTQ